VKLTNRWSERKNDCERDYHILQTKSCRLVVSRGNKEAEAGPNERYTGLKSSQKPHSWTSQNSSASREQFEKAIACFGTDLSLKSFAKLRFVTNTSAQYFFSISTNYEVLWTLLEQMPSY
jgi:hypothetical protein